MRYFQTRGIATRLGLGFGFLIVLLVCIGAVGLVQLQRMQLQAERLVGESIGLLDAVGQLQDIAGQREAMLRELAVAATPDDEATAVHKLQVNALAYAGVARGFAAIAGGERAGADAKVILAVGDAIAALEKPLLEAQELAVDPAKRDQAPQRALPRYRELHGLLRACFSATRAEADASVAGRRAGASSWCGPGDCRPGGRGDPAGCRRRLRHHPWRGALAARGPRGGAAGSPG